MASVISIDGLSVTLGGHFRALQDVSVELEAGKITGFIGPSGAGKTTLIRAIVGRQKFAAGTLTVLGLPAGSSQLRPQVTYMTQEQAIYDDLCIMENLRYFANMAGYYGKQAKSVCLRVLRAVDLTDKSATLARDLSGGQKQRVSLAIALIGDLKLLVLDEPTVGLDPMLREDLWRLFRELAQQGKTIIISSHAMDEAQRCDDLILIRNGHIVAHDTPHGLCEHTGTKTVEASFLKLAGGSA